MISTKKMKALEINSEALGVPTLLLMENAGRSVRDEIIKRFNPEGLKVKVFVGHGGKGGDGLVAARHLAGDGADVEVFLLGENKHRDAILNLNAIEEMDYSIKVTEIKDVFQLSPVEGDVLIDAMLGTGFSGKPREPFATAIKVFNNSKGFKVSIDVPSGIDSDSGEAPSEYVNPDLIVTFHDMKLGLRNFVEKTAIKKIGIPKEAEIYVGPGDVVVNIRKRDFKAKKGDNGRVLVIGGSYTFSGAPTLSALASLRTGADLVYVASPEETARIIAGFSPNLITIKLKGRNISPESLEELKPWISRADVVVVGPGMGMEPETVEASKLIVNYLKSTNKPAVIDADALKANAGIGLYPNAVITPHIGEFKIFFGEQVKESIKERVKQVVEASRKCNCVVLMKGYIDIISNGTEFRLNKTGNPGLAVGGTGDTLTGIVATFMAQKIDPFTAAYIGVFVNSLAGSLAYRKLGEHIVATDIVKHIPEVLNNPVEAFRNKVYKRIING
ncbi:NAD(P)H-hydrate dehydratase [Stygiolobus caldivivus]|uniref:Bifunctional NAD(P)H-hydrate repair enzyme n=1 Tax=Stygiolobus caldivivus TaxID=2824673 RepID=A0A8D5ZI88_9CREN|nr:NAD(P)H-hydrate dehydratase [Stygiolobus caldivivus]BCU69225.1 bifunctional ADP-dependent NAD(P)H-hydrate dehydratase/NAD(P)H-hydrate epimerase [Stygiolobus caldivivus]